MLKNYYQFLTHLSPVLYDQAIITPERQFTPFAFTDMLTTQMSANGQPVLHYWQLDQSVILGMKDSRVPLFKDALTSLTDKGYHVMLRNSGGLGIVADQGILNISFILPNPDTHTLNISSAYELVMAIIQTAFADFSQTIEAKEITDSYCPGDYDLSINGQKFAGIAQRRIKNGISVMIYLSVNGNQQARGELMHAFYQIGLGDDFGSNGYPPVNPHSMANLETLLQTELSIDEVKSRVTAAFQQLFTTPLASMDEEYFTSDIATNEAMARQVERMTDRNELITTLIGGLDGDIV
ncbi:lipoate--protein ligase family protein [Vagococcus xieshaowenii]|uniref:Octanoyl-[GcvH]:protein N-octanoyltransferase n=1 Tax=Vagococcus xieshaowenii TaxID=2562451 RepID=A0AAJ5JL81_9ENTE|nr:lipoate--protein ligase family protein [Vagococcus xieshaowenii]QCA29084.1 lipoate--protein ligase family protein [Vagococcus xieshaowenii]TFZ40940.1 lipoate--protein ligase family protein [Vagococcus xieshaowenii]